MLFATAWEIKISTGIFSHVCRNTREKNIFQLNSISWSTFGVWREIALSKSFAERTERKKDKSSFFRSISKRIWGKRRNRKNSIILQLVRGKRMRMRENRALREWKTTLALRIRLKRGKSSNFPRARESESELWSHT